MIGSDIELSCVLSIYPNGLYVTIKELQGVHILQIEPTVAEIGESYHTGEVGVTQWVLGQKKMRPL